MIKKFYPFILSIALISCIEAFCINKFGVFEDSENYYRIYHDIKNTGLLDSILNFTLQINKFEPIIFLIFYFQSYFIPENSSFSFLYINFVFLNSAILYSISKIFPLQKNKYLIFSIFIVLLSYGFFSKLIYIWRTLYALSLFLISISSQKKFYKILFLTLALLSHSTMLIFIVGYYFFSFLSAQFNKTKFLFLAVIIAILINIVFHNTNIGANLVSGGNLDVFFAKNESHYIQSIINVSITLVLLLYCYKHANSRIHISLIISLIFFTFVGLLNSESYHFMNRIAGPSIALAPFIIFSQEDRFANNCYRFIVFVTCFATIRLLLIFATSS
jgi:hypothetical protein